MGFFEIFAAVKEWDGGSLTSKFFLSIGLWLMIRKELGKDKKQILERLALIEEDLKKVKAHVGLDDKKEN